MKRRFFSVLALCLAIMMVLSACNKPSDPSSDTTATQGATTQESFDTGITEDTTDPNATSEDTTEEASESETTTEPVSTEPEDPLARYELGYKSDMDMSAFDPITNKETVTAPDDDAALQLWFDHITEKVDRYNTKSTGRDSYTIQMGKNEYEGCQFFVHHPENKRITLKISDFTNENGDKLHTELGVEYYVEDGYVSLKYGNEPVYPDAVIPYESYISKTEGGNYEEGAWVTIGPYSYKPWDLENHPYRDTSRGFVVQAKTTADTVPGAYKATIEIFDADTGKCIKMANVYTYVYNVTLSEETALDTSFQIWAAKILEQYSHFGSTASHNDILKAVSDFLLDYRITTSNTVDFGTEWLSNPRVTTIRVTTKEQYDMLKDNPLLKDKLFFYGQDEPGTPRPNMGDPTGYNSIEKLKEEAEMLINDWGWEDYRMVSPFELDLAYTKNGCRDQIEFMEKYVNIWCPKFFSFTPRALSFKEGSKYTHSTMQDSRFGEFSVRMRKYVAHGDELWAYVSCQPTYTAPYQNILIYNDGTEARTMFWTCFKLDVTGFLYWHVANYDGVGDNTFTMRCPFPKEGPGDGILIYPGAVYGQVDPIPSIRLINMREGIEDYQLLTMLEEAMGKSYTDELVRHIVTSTITFTRDDDVVYNVHSYLLRALEEASK